MQVKKKKENPFKFQIEGVYMNKKAVCPRCGNEHLVGAGRFGGVGRLWEYVVCKSGISYLVNI
jgi:hypothetical protein